METLPTIKSIADIAKVIEGTKNNLMSSPEKVHAMALVENIATAINDLVLNLENNMPQSGSAPAPGRPHSGPGHRGIEGNLLMLTTVMRRSDIDPQVTMELRREMRNIRHLRMFNNQYFDLPEDVRQHNLAALKAAAESFTSISNLIKS